MKTVRCGDVDLAVLDEGKGDPLLLVHGFPLDHTMWARQIAEFTSTHRVIAPDLRGFGRSGVMSGTATMEQMADDLAALLDGLAVPGTVTLCGLSMGGYVAWQFWKRHAARLGRLVLCDTRAVADTPDAAAGRLKTAEKVTTEGSRVVAGAMLPKLFAAGTAAKQPELVAAVERTMRAASPAGIAAALRGMAARPDVTAWLPQIDVPALVAVGEEDQISPPDEMRAIAAALPAARFVLIADAGHMAPLENPTAFNAALREFLAR
jgi:pimeloyl-ACP methyl ester carboxylesterase